MSLEQFNPEHYARGTKHRTLQRVTPEIEIPVLIARGREPGPTLAVSANVHGDEYEGVRAIFEAFDEIKPEEMTGNLIAVPVLNPPAFWSCTRCNPLDGQNLARVFPGDPEGTITQRIAWHFAHGIISHANFYLDLHSGGVSSRMPSMAGYPLQDSRACAAAEIFGASVIWGHATVAPGRTVSFANDRGIPWIYTEARGAGRIAPDDLSMMKHGIFNLLRHLKIIQGDFDTPTIVRRLYGDGNVDSGMTATQDGFLITEVEILEPVKRGQRLGVLLDLKGEQLEEYRAPQDGVVGLVRELPMIRRGDIVFLLAEEQS